MRVTLRDIIIQVRHNSDKACSVRAEIWLFILCIIHLKLICINNLPKSATFSFHVSKPFEYVRKQRISSLEFGVFLHIFLQLFVPILNNVFHVSFSIL